MHAADEQIEQLLAKGAIMQCDSINENDFVSMVFLHPKKDGGFRMILNLKGFNEYIEYQHFKMETIKDIMHAIVPNCFMAVVDLSDAYLVVLISKWHWRLLKFCWRGKIYCYLVLPFGLACTPRVFTKVAKVPLSLVREKAILLSCTSMMVSSWVTPSNNALQQFVVFWMFLPLWGFCHTLASACCTHHSRFLCLVLL